MLGIPTFFDLVATILMNVGLVSVTASVYQMLRGAEMLFAALFAVVFLGRKLNRYHYGGIACCLVSPLSKQDALAAFLYVELCRYAVRRAVSGSLLSKEAD